MKPEEMVNATFTVAPVRSMRTRVLEGIGREDWRRIIADTYPSTLDGLDTGWFERWGQDVDWTATELYDIALRENWARKTVAAAGKLWATHMAKFSGAVVRRPVEVPDEVVLDAVHRVCVMRPGVEASAARATIRALLVLGWRPPQD